jgi:hypothetical protein
MREMTLLETIIPESGDGEKEEAPANPVTVLNRMNHQ